MKNVEKVYMQMGQAAPKAYPTIEMVSNFCISEKDALSRPLTS